MKCEQRVVRRNQILTCTVLLGGGTNTRLRFYRQARTCISPVLSVFLRGRHHPFPRLPSCHLDKGQDKKTTTAILKRPCIFGQNYRKVTGNPKTTGLFSPHLLVRWHLPAVCDGCQLWAPSSCGGVHLWPSCVVWRHPNPSHRPKDSPAGWARHLMWLWTWGWQSSPFPY